MGPSLPKWVEVLEALREKESLWAAEVVQDWLCQRVCLQIAKNQWWSDPGICSFCHTFIRGFYLCFAGRIDYEIPYF